MVSIITPVYNCDEFLEECIQSVLNQTFHDWELILIDDSVQALNNYKKQLNQSISEIQTEISLMNQETIELQE